MDLYENLNSRDKDEFTRICNKLFSICFINKHSDKTKKDYYFILKNKQLFESYIGVLGFRLDINEDYGVIQMVNNKNYNHLNLKLYESIILLILRIIYDEKRRELSLSNEVIISIGDIQEKFRALNIREKPIDKTTMSSSLKLFKKFNLIEPQDKDLTNEDTSLIIYNSILMAVRMDDIQKIYKNLEVYKKGGDSDEEIDEDEID